MPRKKTWNKQAILDSYQSEIFCYTMNPLMTKPREYKTKLFSQDDWILALFFFYFFMDRDFVSVHKNAKKKKKNSAMSSHFDLTLGQ